MISTKDILMAEDMFLNEQISSGDLEEANEEDELLDNFYGIEVMKLELKSGLESVRDNNTISNDLITDINKNLDRDVSRLEDKINKVIEKLRGAVLAERKVSGSIFTTILPLTDQQTNNNITTATISDNIIFGLSSKPNAENINLLTLSNLDFKNLQLTSLNKQNLEYLENFKLSPKTNYKEVLEFSINLRSIIQSSSNLILDLKEHAIIEIYINNKLYRNRELKKKFIIPVDQNTQSVTLRCYETVHKTTELFFNKIGITNLLYTDSTVFESKSLAINKTLKYLCVDTCDNSSNTTINYSISINDSEYEDISPVSKESALNKQSIILLDKDSSLNLLKLDPVKIAEGDIRYYIPNDLQNIVNYEVLVFMPNNKNIMNREIHVVMSQDLVLAKQAITGNENYKLYIDNREIKEDVVTLTKGFHSLIVTDIYNNITSNNYQYLLDTVGRDNIFINKSPKLLTSSTDSIKYITMTIPELKDSYELYGPIYIKGIPQSKYVGNVKIRALLSSQDRTTVPYISKILIRGL